MSEIVRSVDRVLDILLCFSEDKPLLTVPEISELTGLTKSTVFRLLASLEHKGFIEKNEITHQYKLGLALLRLGTIVQSSFNLRESAAPFMKKLSELTQETVSLSTWRGMNRICIDKIDGKQILRHVAFIGESLPLYAGSAGKVLLAFNDDQEHIIEVLKEAKKYLTKEQVNKLKIDLFDIREKGYALTNSERVEGITSISAPIRNYTGKVIGGITLAGPSIRFTDAKVSYFTEKVLEASEQISRNLGFVIEENANVRKKLLSSD